MESRTEEEEVEEEQTGRPLRETSLCRASVFRTRVPMLSFFLSFARYDQQITITTTARRRDGAVVNTLACTTWYVVAWRIKSWMHGCMEWSVV